MAGSYSNACATITTTRSVAVFLGGATVTADQTATGGVSIAAGTTAIIPSNGDTGRDLYAITPSSTAVVGYLLC